MKMCCASTPAPDPVVSDPLGAYALPPQATDGLVQQDIDPLQNINRCRGLAS